MATLKEQIDTTIITAIDGKMAKDSSIRIEDGYLLRERRENRISNPNYIIREVMCGNFRERINKRVYACNNNIDTQIFKQEGAMAKLEQKRTKKEDMVMAEPEHHEVEKTNFLVDFRKLHTFKFNNVTVKSYKDRVVINLNGKELMNVYAKDGLMQFTSHESIGWIAPDNQIQQEFVME